MALLPYHLIQGGILYGMESTAMDPLKPDFEHEVNIVIDMPGYDPSIQPEPGETRRALLKVDLLILPFIVICFCFLQFDRTNIGNALTDTLRADIQVDNSAINLAQTLFTVGFVITELPFNVISRYMGPERFLPITMFLWGVATWSQIFIKNASGLQAARFFIGALEGGYIPGFALYISKFYTNQELALRYAIFWASNSFAGILGGPFAIGLLSLGGRHGLGGWQWLFLIEGVLTCFLGLVAYIYLPHSAVTPKTFFGRSFNTFTAREGSILTTRVIKNDPTKAYRQKNRVSPSDILETFLDWRLYGHIIGGFLSMVMISPMNTYAPSIIKGLGFTSLQANGLNSVGSACALVMSILLAFSSDRFQERGVHIAIGYLWGAAGILWLALTPEASGKWILYGGVIWTQMGMGCAQAISAAWLTAKMQDHKRPAALAAYVMSIQLANFPGNQLFRSQDAPRYTRGLIIAASCTIAAAVVILFWKLLYRLYDHGDSGVEVKYGVAEPREKQIEPQGGSQGV
ncbi:MFS general substrate transporter [Aspergillus affinis]|uniref:MFS general substrate transporter n=1 Tax=Aspergillus affinis TaxID=1070780 RepID=UPI0022FF30EE|nr:MFS general substrate transporter [Aspergillus affinis]KAI9042015.1 MFS general substrate transporter [Aspergillus affinis]